MMYLSILLACLFLACLWFSYELGRVKKTLVEFEKYEYMFEEARKARDSLNDKSVRSELRDKYKR